MYAEIVTFAGGIGLFLLGMRLITDGLKISAGQALRSILAAATRNPLRGLASGLLITTVVQSSSAVIFATIGFVNAGLLSLRQAIGIVYGSNLGTTLTSWVVALVGYNINLQALSMPALGLGMALWITSGTSRRGALGQAIAGFGLFFLGIDVLRAGFADLGTAVSLEDWAHHGVLSLVIFLLAGALLTVLMQSSSAALVVTLTAAAGGLVPVQAAAAMIIGANVGTTSTAAFAAFGATSPAKRVAAAHVLFNLATGVAAFTLLVPLLWLAEGAGAVVAGTAGHAAVTLAVFHTLTKLAGLGIMWPLTERLVAVLEQRFRSAEEDEARPHHLDRNVLATPALALDALGMELHSMGGIARRLCAEGLSGEHVPAQRLERGSEALDHLHAAIGEFAAGIHRHEKDPQLVEALPNALRVAQYYVNMGELAQGLARLQPQAHIESSDAAQALAHMRAEAAALLRATRVDRDDWDATVVQAARDDFEIGYQALKARILRAATVGGITPRHMAAVLEHCSVLHRICDQATKSALYLDRYLREHDGPAPGPADAAGADR